MSEGGDVPIVDLDVLDALGEPVGRVEEVPLSTLARHLPVTLGEDAREALGVDEALIELPAQWIRHRGADAVELSRGMDEIRELLDPSVDEDD